VPILAPGLEGLSNKFFKDQGSKSCSARSPEKLNSIKIFGGVLPTHSGLEASREAEDEKSKTLFLYLFPH
jgi:hypothetical protein